MYGFSYVDSRNLSFVKDLNWSQIVEVIQKVLLSILGKLEDYSYQHFLFRVQI